MADILQASSSTLAQLPSPSSSHLPTPLSSLLLSHSHTAVSVLLFVANLALQCWHLLRTWVLIPIVQLSVYACLVMSIMLVIEKVFMGAVSLYDKVFQRRPERMYKWRPMGDRDDDPEKGNLEYPMVLVQVPMFNEKEVYQLSIGAACNLSWPAERVIIQVLDDSTDPVVKELVASECRMWSAKGKNIRYERRSNRDGYKAGALKKGMKYDYVSKCDYVAIFDADFQPDPDFLLRTIPFLVCNTDIALVQARWKFVNANECLMTRIQEMSMDYHFKVEQESGSSTHAFFGFNGTAGVWRIHALEEAGGWKDRTTVEDMDLAVRAFLGGWKFVYIGDIKVKSELPSTFKAYRNQQHRWSCGPANLLRKMAWEIITNKKVAVYKKFYVIYNFFVARRIVAHIVTFFLYCIVIPTSVFFPEVYIPKWVIVYVPTTITLLNSVGTPSSFHLILFWILFENVMAMHRSKAVLIGLFEAGRVNEWVVTEKLGDTMTKPKVVATINANGNDIEAPLLLPAPPPAKKKKKKNLLDGLNLLELSLSAYLFVCATWDLLYAHNRYYIYVYPQSVTFLMMGVGYVGTFV